MRIAIFDGILETHVASSLQRALERRGHEVFNTQRIGHGFRFPSAGADKSHLAWAVGQVLDFVPDVVFVMRPASLPFDLLKRLQRSGTCLMAWFSDDPVLFDLSYGPIVNSYDYVLHCGNARVLAFYEERFGRPTGVNIPFWTDHDSFPCVWGTEDPDADVMFLGNVHDEVRRARYFELARMSSSLKIHGAVGADYLGISAGYLDNDEEVVASGARTRLALNIPQFFKNHLGLETWFEGLAELGFFEYPSRVVQYMAMGIPTISVVPGESGFRSFPEMLVATDIPDADRQARDLIESGRLEEVSKATALRFDRHFSADARVLAIESLLANDDWKSLDAEEREIWFTQFDATEVPRDVKQSTVLEVTAPDKPSGVPPVTLFGMGWTRETSRVSAVGASMESAGINYVKSNPVVVPGVLIDDSSRVCQKVMDVSKLLRSEQLVEGGVLVIAGVDARLTEPGAALLREKGISSILFDDTGRLDLERGISLASRFDVVATQSYELYLQLQRRGFENVEFAPHFVNPRYLAELNKVDEVHDSVHVRVDLQAEESNCPAMVWDAGSVAAQTHRYVDIEGCSLAELAKLLRARVAMMSPAGNRQFPRVHELAPYVAVSADWLFHARHAVWERLHPYGLLGVNVLNQGELAVKAESLSRSSRLQDMTRNRRDHGLTLVTQGPRLVTKLVQRALEACESGRRFEPLAAGAVVPVELEGAGGTHSTGHAIHLELNPLQGQVSDWWVRVRVNGEAVQGFTGSTSMDLLVLKPAASDAIRVELVYRGTRRNILAAGAIRSRGTIASRSVGASAGAVKQGAISLTGISI